MPGANLGELRESNSDEKEEALNMTERNSRTGRLLSRREFVRDSAVVAGLAAFPRLAGGQTPTQKPLNFNEKMEYRRLGKTGLMVSAVCLGGHWKRISTLIGGITERETWNRLFLSHPEFIKNRSEIVSYCIDAGINYVDACNASEILAYSRALQGRRDQMYFGWSWVEKEPREKEWRTAASLLQGLDEGLQEAGMDYVDVWRISVIMPSSEHTFNEVYEVVEALDTAKKQGKARFTGVSSHDHRWLKIVIDEFPAQMEVILFPYTAKSKELPKEGLAAVQKRDMEVSYPNTEKRAELPRESLFEAVQRNDVGVFGIKPFASNSLFKGSSALDNPDAEEDDRRARLAIRYILGNPGITAPIPGLINRHQVDNMVRAIQERRELDRKEAAELEKAAEETWTRLPEEYQWLKNWEYV